MAPSPFSSSTSSSSSSSSPSDSSLSSSQSQPFQPQSHSQPMVFLHSQQQQQPKRSSVASTSASSTTALAAAARRPSPTDALKHLRPAIPSPNTLLASLLANPDPTQLDFLSLFDTPATLPSDLLNNITNKDSPAMDEYYGAGASAGYPTYPPTNVPPVYAQRRLGLPSVSPTGTSRTAPAAAGMGYHPQAPYPYSSHQPYANNLGQYAPPSAASHNAHHVAAAAAALRLQQQQQQQQQQQASAYADAFRTRAGAYHGYPGQMQYTQAPRSGVNGYMPEAEDEDEDVYGFMSASHLAHARSTAAASASARQPPSVGVVNPSALDTYASQAPASSSTALTLQHDSTPNHAVRLQYAPDGRSLLRADHTHHACQDPMVLGGRLVDMSVHMEHYLQDLLPRKGEDHSDWQPVDITFDILSSRLRQTLEQMERFRGDMTRKASVERKKVAERERGKATKRLQGSRAVKPVTASAAGSAAAGGNSSKASRAAGGNSSKASRAAVTDPVRS